ncbi:MAG: alpha/beta fold hydrolase [Firmicutes bacterium]|nr:alpha/beta fold hydrolase [Bacillota bacterium]
MIHGGLLKGLFAGCLALSLFGQEGADPRLKAMQRELQALKWELESLRKATDDVLWFQRLSDVAEVDKVTYVGPPNPKRPENYGIVNSRVPMKLYQYVFVPRNLDKGKKHPLLVLPHGGTHADFTTYHVHIIREMMARGYVVLAPEYRGSTGYGKEFYEAADYGGLEIDDVVAGRDWAVENLSFVDGHRAAIVGWSHGGLIAMMAVFDHPEKFRAAYAGVPVSDLLARVGYAGDEYKDESVIRGLFGKTATEDVDRYRRRSPIWNVEKLKTPLLIHTSTNDQDVNSVEVEQLIRALKAAGKTFEYKIYQDAPGGHSFNRIDTALARQSRQEIYDFLAKHLK